MARAISNVEITTDTFAGLVEKTNELLNAITYEVVTTSNTSSGANTSGNTNIIGILAANAVSTPVVRGGSSGNVASFSSLTVGHSNSTTSSNVTITGYTANVTANSLNVSSNTTFSASNLNITATALTINSVTTATGNALFKANSSLNVLDVHSNSTITEVIVNANTFTVNATFNLSGGGFGVQGNVTLGSNTIFVNSVDDYVGINTTSPTHKLHIVSGATDPTLKIENTTQNTLLLAGGVSGDGNGNTSVVYAGSNTHLKLSSNNNGGLGYVFMAANGNVGIANDDPVAQLQVSSTKLYANGKVTTGSDLEVTGDVYANIIFMGGTAAICPLVPPGLGSNTYLYFTNTTPQIIDTVSKTDYQAVKYSLQVQNNDVANDVLFTEISMVYGYGLAHSTQYGTIFSNTQFADITSSSNATHYWIQGAPTSAYLSEKGGSVKLEFRGIRLKCK